MLKVRETSYREHKRVSLEAGIGCMYLIFAERGGHGDEEVVWEITSMPRSLISYLGLGWDERLKTLIRFYDRGNTLDWIETEKAQQEQHVHVTFYQNATPRVVGPVLVRMSEFEEILQAIVDFWSS